MAVKLITAPTEEALDLAEVKEFLGMGDADENDTRVRGLIRSAREAFEKYYGALLSSTWEMALDRFPCGDVVIQRLLSVTSIKYLDSSGAEQTLPADYYGVDAAGIDGGFGYIQLRSGKAWPITCLERRSVRVRYVAGWATRADVPESVKEGLKCNIQQEYDGVDLQDAISNKWGAYRIVPI